LRALGQTVDECDDLKHHGEHERHKRHVTRDLVRENHRRESHGNSLVAGPAAVDSRCVVGQPAVLRGADLRAAGGFFAGAAFFAGADFLAGVDLAAAATFLAVVFLATAVRAVVVGALVVASRPSTTRSPRATRPAYTSAASATKVLTAAGK